MSRTVGFRAKGTIESCGDDFSAGGVRMTTRRGPEERNCGGRRSARDHGRSGGASISWVFRLGHVPARAAYATEGGPRGSDEGGHRVSTCEVDRRCQIRANEAGRRQGISCGSDRSRVRKSRLYGCRRSLRRAGLLDGCDNHGRRSCRERCTTRRRDAIEPVSGSRDDRKDERLSARGGNRSARWQGRDDGERHRTVKRRSASRRVDDERRRAGVHGVGSNISGGWGANRR
jgi:hypothetical protein